MAHNVKLDTLSLEDLKTLQADVTAALTAKVEAKRAELQKQMDELNALTGTVTPATNSTPKPVRQRAKSEYVHVHPVSGHEWEGRGGVPVEWRDIITPDMTKEQVAAEKAKHRVKRKD